jgi:hypothetical protein
MSHLKPCLATLEIGPTTICMAEDKPRLRWTSADTTVRSEVRC